VELSAYEDEFSLMKNKIQLLEKASMELEVFSPETIKLVSDFSSKFEKFEREVEGNPAKAEIGEWDTNTLSMRIRLAMQGLSTSYGPTDLNSSNLEISEKMFNTMKVQIEQMKSELEELEKAVKDLNPPHINGSGIN